MNLSRRSLLSSLLVAPVVAQGAAPITPEPFHVALDNWVRKAVKGLGITGIPSVAGHIKLSAVWHIDPENRFAFFGSISISPERTYHPVDPISGFFKTEKEAIEWRGVGSGDSWFLYPLNEEVSA